MGFSLLLAMFTRTIGLVLVVLTVLCLLFRRGKDAWKELLIVFIGMTVLLGMITVATPLNLRDVLPSAYASQFTSPSSWGQSRQEDEIGLRVVTALSEYFTQHIRETVLPIGSGGREQAFASQLGLPFLPALVSLAFVGVIALGYHRWVSMTGFPVSILFSGIYGCVLILWPWRGSRFLYPLQPYLYLGLILGIAALLSQTFQRLRRGSFLYIVAIGVAILGLASINIYKSLRIDDSRDHTGDLRMRSSWLRDNSELSALIMTEEPQTDYLYSGRKTIPYKDFRSLDEFESYLVGHRVGYIIVGPRLEWQPAYSPAYSPGTKRLLSMLETLAINGRVTVVYDSGQELVKIYKVLITTQEDDG
jgi:hypothetical protein